MGQRHQIFIKVLNPYHHVYNEDKVRAKKMFGTNKTTVLAYHNQWLYGRSALLSALHVLEFAGHSIKKQDYSMAAYSNPFAEKGLSSLSGNGLDHYLKNVESILNFNRDDYEFRNKGWLGSFLLNEGEPEMRHCFNGGDNNDGITIIDTIEAKYCFMNISEYNYGEDEKSFSANDLPYLKPCSGEDYVEAYCPSDLESARNSYYGERAFEKEGEKGLEEYVVKAKEINTALIDRLAKFKVLTNRNLKNIFRKQYKKLEQQGEKT